MKKTTLLLSFVLSFLGFRANAQSDSTASEGAFTLTGYADSYYFANFNRPKSGLNGTRIFDIPAGQFGIGLVQTKMTYTYGKAVAVADLAFGPNADLGNFGNFTSLNAGASTSTSLAIKQAYLSYGLTNKLTFTIGQYGTHIGYELIDAPLNFNYSLSNLFGNGPFYHTGAKLDYAVSSRLGLMVGVINGWDMLQDMNKKKSLAAQMHLVPVSGWDLYVNYIGGGEYNGNSAFGSVDGSATHLYDVTTSLQATQKFKIGVNAALGKYYCNTDEVDPDDQYTRDATWKGAALYLNYDATSKFGLGVRAEHFDDPKGVRYWGRFTGNSLTLTGNVKLADGHFLIKPELRIDAANEARYEDSDGNLTKKSQATIGAAFIYTFGFKR